MIIIKNSQERLLFVFPLPFHLKPKLRKVHNLTFNSFNKFCCYCLLVASSHTCFTFMQRFLTYYLSFSSLRLYFLDGAVDIQVVKWEAGKGQSQHPKPASLTCIQSPFVYSIPSPGVLTSCSLSSISSRQCSSYRILTI